MPSPRTTALGWSSQDARDHFEERAAIIQASLGWTEAESEMEAVIQIMRTACAWCGEPHQGGPERCRK